MSWNPTKGNLSPRGSLLDRVASNSQKEAPTETQLGVDRLVGSAVQAVSDEKMMASLFTAGAAGKFIRLGSLARSASALESLALRALSHTTALAGESAIFAGMERKFAAWEGHAATQSFQKDWGRAFINLGSLKLLGGAAASQNLIVQHLFADLGMIAGHEAGYALGMTEAPQGNLAQRIIQAEGMNLSMKGSLALLHGFSPGLSAMEKSVDLALMARETNPFSKNPSVSFFPELALAMEGSKGLLESAPKGPEDLSLVFSKGDSKGGSDKADFASGKFESQRGSDEDARDSAALALVQTGVKGTKLAETLHRSAMEFSTKAEAFPRNSLAARELHQRAMELEWGAAAAVESGHEPARSVLYRNAVWSALKAGRLDSAGEILGEGLRGDPLGNFEHEIRKSVKDLRFYDRNKRFILNKLDVAKEYQKVPFELPRVSSKGNEESPPAKVELTSLQWVEALHGEAMKLSLVAGALGRRDPLKQENYGRAMELEWNAAAEIPPRNEKRRADLYRSALWLALKAGRPADAKKIIFNALLNDFGALAEDAIRRSAEKLWWWNGNKKFILATLEEGKASRKLMEVLQPGLSSSGTLASKPMPPIIMMSGTPKKNKDSGEGSSGS